MATVQKRGNAYKITVSCGYDDTGKQLREHFTWSPAPNMTANQIEKELEKQKVLFENQVKKGDFFSGNIRFSEFAAYYMTEYSQKQHKARTYALNESFIKRINSKLGNMKVKDIKSLHLDNFYSSLASKGANKNKSECGLAPKTIKNYHTMLSSIFQYAIKKGMIGVNPCRNADTPKLIKTEAQHLDEHETMQFLECIQSAPLKWRLMIEILIYTGIRRGELFGLQWSNIDLEQSNLSIVQELLYLPKKGLFLDTPKTTSSERKITLPNNLIILLKQQRKEQNENKLRLANLWNDTGFVFTAWNGQPMNPTSLNVWLDKFTKKHSLTKIHPHSLRHTFATLLIASGDVDIKSISSYLGHSKTTTTLDIYAHALKSSAQRMPSTIQNMIDKAKVKCIG